MENIKLSINRAEEKKLPSNPDAEQSLIAKFGEGATKSGVTLKGIFEKALGGKKKKKEEK